MWSKNVWPNSFVSLFSTTLLFDIVTQLSFSLEICKKSLKRISVCICNLQAIDCWYVGICVWRVNTGEVWIRQCIFLSLARNWASVAFLLFRDFKNILHIKRGLIKIFSFRPWLKLMWMLRQPMATFSVFSALGSQRSAPTRSGRPPMPSTSRSVRSARRWWKSWPVRFKLMTWRKWSTSCKWISVHEVSIQLLAQCINLFAVLCSRIPDSVGKDIEKACQSIYPLHDVYVRKVKMLKKPKFECK